MSYDARNFALSPGGVWLPLNLDAGGALRVTGGGGGTFAAAATYLDNPPILQDTDEQSLLVTQQGWLQVSDQRVPQYEDNANGLAAVIDSPKPVTNYSVRADHAIATVSGVAKVVAGNVLSLSSLWEDGGGPPTSAFFQLFNLAAAPTSGVTAPTFSFALNSTERLTLDRGFWTMGGFHMATGIAWGFSSTQNVFTTLAGFTTLETTIGFI